MSGSVTVTTDGISTLLAAPYDPGLPAKAKRIGGRWSPESKTWLFAARDEARVRELAREVYGTDGSDADGPTVTVRVTVEGDKMEGQEFRLAGQRLAWRPSRDDDVRLSGGVVIVSGEFPPTGGSVRYPALAEYGASAVVLEVRDVPADQAARMVEQGASMVNAAAVDRETLEAERAQLLARLAAIDAQLGPEA